MKKVGSGELTLPITNTFQSVYKAKRGEVPDYSDSPPGQICIGSSLLIRWMLKKIECGAEAPDGLDSELDDSLVLQDRHDSTDEGDNRTDEGEPESDTDLVRVTK